MLCSPPRFAPWLTPALWAGTCGTSGAGGPEFPDPVRVPGEVRGRRWAPFLRAGPHSRCVLRRHRAGVHSHSGRSRGALALEGLSVPSWSEAAGSRRPAPAWVGGLHRGRTCSTACPFSASRSGQLGRQSGRRAPIGWLVSGGGATGAWRRSRRAFSCAVALPADLDALSSAGDAHGSLWLLE